METNTSDQKSTSPDSSGNGLSMRFAIICRDRRDTFALFSSHRCDKKGLLTIDIVYRTHYECSLTWLQGERAVPRIMVQLSLSTGPPIIIGLIAGGTGIVILIVVCVVCLYWRKSKTKRKDEEVVDDGGFGSAIKLPTLGRNYKINSIPNAEHPDESRKSSACSNHSHDHHEVVVSFDYKPCLSSSTQDLVWNHSEIVYSLYCPTVLHILSTFRLD